jgi:predicted DNA-binding transcriptional regulator YafY
VVQTGAVPRLERLLAIALHLGARRRLLARDLADRFGVSLRTIYRDMRVLAAAGFPVEGTAGDGYRLLQDSYLRPLALAPDEAEALALAARGHGATAPASLKEPLARATTKVEAVLDRMTRERVRELERRIVVPGFARTLGPDADVLAAIHERRSARIRYAPAGERATERTIEPLGLVCRGDAWWLVAYCRLRRDARAFRLDAIARWRAGASFVPRPGFAFAEIIARDRHLAERLFGY